MILTFQNQKGGVGKTTLSIHVAHELARRGRKVLVVDADPQGSARDWLVAREKQAQFAVIGFDRPTIHRDLEKIAGDYEDVVIDSPPRVTDIARSAMLAADLIVIPVQPSPYDVWAASETVELIKDSSVYKEKQKAVFMINREIVKTAIGRDVAEALEAFKLPVLRSHVSQRVIFAESVTRGETVFEIDEESKAAREVMDLTNEILDILETS